MSFPVGSSRTKVVVLVVGLGLVGTWQLQQVGGSSSAEALLPSQWWHFLILAVLVIGGWQLVRASTQAHADLDHDARIASRYLFAGLPAVLLTVITLYCWEVLIIGLQVSAVLLPAPSRIASAVVASGSILWYDFIQTVIKSVIPGYLIGCSAGFAVACLAWRLPNLGRGLLPLGNFMSVLPIVGVAPIMVMWFGFDWQSKAAVAALMTFFPMMVNCLSGFSAAGQLEQDLMHTYAARRSVFFTKLVLPAALPFIFNGLKICSTLALIGAIVAEFFGTPIVGMGFRISSEVGRMGLDVVWATIVVAAVAGTSFYGLLVTIERATTFWDASWR